MPIMLQQGLEPMSKQLILILRASLVLGRIPINWRHRYKGSIYTKTREIFDPGEVPKTYQFNVIYTQNS